MRAHSPKESKKQATHIESDLNSTTNQYTSLQFTDRRPEVAAQLKLKNLANTYTSNQRFPVQKKTNDTGLPNNLKTSVERLSGHSMDDVKVHYNSDKPARLNAHAYAQGTDIHIASGQEKHLPHEAWHVVQQKQGRVQPSLQTKEGININDDSGLEKEADEMGAKSIASGHNSSLCHMQDLQYDSNSKTTQQRSKDSIIQRMLTIEESGKTYKPPHGLQLSQKGDFVGKFRLPGTSHSYVEFAESIGVEEKFLEDTLRRLDEMAKDGVERGEMTWRQAILMAYEAVYVPPKFDREQFSHFGKEADSVGDLPIPLVDKEKEIGPINDLSSPISKENSRSGLLQIMKQNDAENSLLESLGGGKVNSAFFVQNIRELRRLTLVSKEIRIRVLSFLAKRGISLQMIRGVYESTSPIERAMPGIIELGNYLLKEKPPNEYVYLVPGGSMVPVAVYMRQHIPGVTIIHMPISGLSEDALQKDPRKFEPKNYGVFYQYFLGQYAQTAFESTMLSSAKELSSSSSKKASNYQPLKKLLLIDYSDTGTSVRTIMNHLLTYLKILGVPHPEKFIESFEFNTRLSEKLSPGSMEIGSQSAIEVLRLALKKERFKHAGRLLFDKPGGKAGNFTGTKEDVRKQSLLVNNFSALWFEIQKELMRVNKQGGK